MIQNWAQNDTEIYEEKVSIKINLIRIPMIIFIGTVP